MSGHGGFSIIGGGMPQNIPQELPKIEEITQNKKLDALNVDTKKETAPAAESNLERTTRLVASLDVMLLKAAKSATSAVKADAIKSTIAGAGLDKATCKAINDAAAEAEKSFRAIAKFSGRQLAGAFIKVDGENGQGSYFDWDMNSPVGKAVNDALEAQAKLSDLLRNALNKLPKTAGVSVQDAIEEAMLQTDRRASEMMALLCDFADMAEKNGNDPEVAARLDKTLESLIPSQSLKMHDSQKIVSDFHTALLPLAKRIDTLASKKERELTPEEDASIRRQIDEAYNAIALAEKKYIEKGTPLDHSLIEALKGTLKDLENRVDSLKREVILVSLHNFVDEVFTPPDIPLLKDKFMPIFKKMFPTLGKVIETQKLLSEAARNYIADPTPKNLKRMNSLVIRIEGYAAEAEKEAKILTDMGDYAPRRNIGNLGVREHHDVNDFFASLPADLRGKCDESFIQEFCDAVHSLCFSDNREIEKAKLRGSFSRLNGLQTQTQHLVDMIKNASVMGREKFLTNKTLVAAFEGKIALTTLVETRINGLPDEDADPALDDSNLVSSKPLGHGNVNTVHQVVFKDDKTYIFKPEAPGRQALAELQLTKSHKQKQLMAQLNMASQKTAEHFGLEDIMTKTKVGSHDNQFGIFMEKAPGKEAQEYSRPFPGKTPGALNADQIKELKDEEYAKVIGNIMRKANRLQWFDLLTGQGDRHAKNYMVHVAPGGKVTLKGIDNDACFGEYQVGPGCFHLKGIYVDYFDHIFDDVMQVFGQTQEDRQRLKNDPGITRRPDGSIFINTSLIQSKELLYCIEMSTGTHSPLSLDCIDKELFLKLMSMEQGADREAYIADLRSRLPEEQVNVAVHRLDEAIRLAKTLNEMGRVIPEESWNDHDVQRVLAGKAPEKLNIPDDLSDEEERFARRVQNNVKNLSCVNIFRRDLIPALAKAGWFD